jgi:hypothetical protein
MAVIHAITVSIYQCDTTIGKSIQNSWTLFSIGLRNILDVSTIENLQQDLTLPSHFLPTL